MAKVCRNKRTGRFAKCSGRRSAFGSVGGTRKRARRRVCRKKNGQFMKCR